MSNRFGNIVTYIPFPTKDFSLSDFLNVTRAVNANLGELNVSYFEGRTAYGDIDPSFLPRSVDADTVIVFAFMHTALSLFNSSSLYEDKVKIVFSLDEYREDLFGQDVFVFPYHKHRDNLANLQAELKTFFEQRFDLSQNV